MPNSYLHAVGRGNTASAVANKSSGLAVLGFASSCVSDPFLEPFEESWQSEAAERKDHLSLNKKPALKAF